MNENNSAVNNCNHAMNGSWPQASEESEVAPGPAACMSERDAISSTPAATIQSFQAAVSVHSSLRTIATVPEAAASNSKHQENTAHEGSDNLQCATEQQAPTFEIPSKIEEYAPWIEERGSEARRSYDWAVHLIHRFCRSRDIRMRLNASIWLQKGKFDFRHRSLHGSLSKSPLSSYGNDEEFIKSAFHRVCEALQSLQEQLDMPQAYGVKGEAKKAETGKTINYSNLFQEWFKVLEDRYAEYADSASVLIGAESMDDHSDFGQLIEKLSTDALASSRLKSSLCRACPEHCHPHHTAYLSLEPDKPNANPDDPEGAGDAEVKKEESKATWRMAFESTIRENNHTLIWLKVVSTIRVDASTRLRTVIQLPAGEVVEGSAVTDSPTTDAADEDHGWEVQSRKRRASSASLLDRPAKMRTRPSHVRRATDPILGTYALSGIEVCPEYLSARETIEDAIIMKMSDGGGCDHRVFYLPQATRSAFGAKPSEITLAAVLLGRRQNRYKPSWNLLWVVRMARLISEAVLRFDLRDSDPRPEDCIVFYGGDRKKSDLVLSPFLRFKIPNPGPPDVGLATAQNEDRPASAGCSRGSVMLALGDILLQLGANWDAKLQGKPSGEDHLKTYILSNAHLTGSVHKKYASAVTNCARLYGELKTMQEATFRHEFVKRVVQPLKDCENIIDTQDREGKRLPTGA